MNRIEVLKDIKETLGLVPKFFEGLPDGELEHEWGIFKNLELGTSLIPNKYKELIGVAVAAALRCRYCSLFHTEAARLNGATEDEIHEALRMAKLTSGWSAYLNGSQYDYDLFRREMADIVRYITEKARAVPVAVGRYDI